MEQQTEQIKRFDAKTEIKILKALNAFFDYAKNAISEEEAIKECYVYDPANVCLIIAKSEEAKRVLYKFKEKDSSFMYNNNVEELYKGYSESGGAYSSEYLKKVIALMYVFKEKSIKIYSRFECPCIFENLHFKAIVAPRINEDI